MNSGHQHDKSIEIDPMSSELGAPVDLGTALDSARRAYNKLYPKLQLIFDN